MQDLKLLIEKLEKITSKKVVLKEGGGYAQNDYDIITIFGAKGKKTRAGQEDITNFYKQGKVPDTSHYELLKVTSKILKIPVGLLKKNSEEWKHLGDGARGTSIVVSLRKTKPMVEFIILPGDFTKKEAEGMFEDVRPYYAEDFATDTEDYFD